MARQECGFCTVFVEPSTCVCLSNVNRIIYHIYVHCVIVQRLPELVNGVEDVFITVRGIFLFVYWLGYTQLPLHFILLSSCFPPANIHSVNDPVGIVFIYFLFSFVLLVFDVLNLLFIFSLRSTLSAKTSRI